MELNQLPLDLKIEYRPPKKVRKIRRPTDVRVVQIRNMKKDRKWGTPYIVLAKKYCRAGALVEYQGRVMELPKKPFKVLTKNDYDFHMYWWIPKLEFY